MTMLKPKQIKREKLLDRGVSLLLEKGYHATGLKEILEAVQIPKGSFYAYFGSKEEFAAEAVKHYIEPFIQRLSGHLQNPELDGLGALQAYYAELIDEVAQTGFKGGCLLGNLMGEIGDTSPLCRDALLEAVGRYAALQKTALERGQQDGTVRLDKSAKSMADLMLNGWQGALLRMKVEQSVEPLQEVCRELLDDYFRA
ncbi:TetR/AcrR family transcriptional regulator [Methylomonas koyamae]|uniref:TetR family transcriptional regulator n=1 Tax=Methylomonas koyamae TaxID=702114 RepID=A0A291INC0_9GAMM|nr:TetR/AcrR family transcriptional regulator [Methylomonas koyamae]ATG91895.1 TetR family transcriptional regulator [Methylomonas koyamae]OAI28842.1 TetR family transcriptional regulator [Methylomonas koyamae]